MRIAIEGCAHGELENIYNTIEMIEKRENYKVDLLLCCGDFQATRNVDDLNSMAVPKKYQDICTFYKYYSGEKVAPILTIFIGGNHEASNYLQELPYGGWVAPNIYYLGYAGVVNVNGIRIGGISGIYKGFDFYKGHFEHAPYDNESIRSVYHVRQLDVFRLKQLTPNLDIMLSHDWPRGCTNYGNANQLLRFKPHFRDDIQNNKLGSPPLEDILKTLKPKYWFAAHLHCKFSAFIPYDDCNNGTKFLALDKCLPKRRFLQILDLETTLSAPTTKPIQLTYDIEWLSILQTTNHLINAKSTSSYMPGPGCPYRWNFTPTEDELALTKKKFDGSFEIPKNFCRTAEPYNASQSKFNSSRPTAQLNPQTTTFCDLLEIDDPLNLAMVMSGLELNSSSYIDTSLNESTDTSTFNTSTEMTPMKQLRLSMTLPTPRKNENPEELTISDADSDNSNDPTMPDVDSSSLLNSTVSSSFYASNSLLNNADDEKDSLSQKEVEGDKDPSPKRLLNCDQSAPNQEAKKFKRRNQAIYANNDEDSK